MTTLTGIQTLADLPLEAKRVLVRIDLDVPLKKGTTQVLDDTRIKAALPTIMHVAKAGARVIVASHQGRPKAGGPREGLSLEGPGARLAELSGLEVLLPDDCLGDAPKKLVQDQREGQVVLLENLRFHEGEERDDDGFARELLGLFDVYVNDAIAASHKPYASVHALPRMVRDRGCGLLLEKEIRAIGRLVNAPEKPYVAVVGGARLSDKVSLLESLLDRADVICLGGALANTFLMAQGRLMQGSKVEEDRLPLARSLLERAQLKRIKVLLPRDLVVADGPTAGEGKVVAADAIPHGKQALDIGPETVALIEEQLGRATTALFNGPLGACESKAFAQGTRAVAAALSRSEGFTVAVGSDTARAVHAAGEEVAAAIKHVSTGGIASLELLEGRKLPGIEALRR